jgi:hypothetical protein
MPKTDGRLELTLRIPKNVQTGRYVVPVDLRFGSRSLPQFTEAILAIE